MTTIQYNMQRVQSVVSQSMFKRVVSALSVSVGVLFVGYIYLVGALTFSVIEQKNIGQEIKKTTSSLASVELSYLAVERTLTKEYAHAAGFVDYSQVAYTEYTHALAFNTN